MFWPAGLLGLVAVGGMALADIFSDDNEFSDDESEADPDLLDAQTDPIPPEDWLNNATGDTTWDTTGDTTADDGLAEDPGLETGGASDGLILSGGPGVDFLAGGDGNDSLDGAAGPDQLNGYGGDDWLDGAAGDDQLFGEAGDDTLYGGGGADQLHGGYGADSLFGEAGQDQLFGHDGADLLDGGAGADRIEGGLGDDVLWGGAGDDSLQGAEGDDLIVGGAGVDTLFGGWGDDTLSGLEPGEGPDTANPVAGTDTGPDTSDADPDGLAGSDFLNADFLNGGAGADTIVTGAGDVVTAGEDGDSIVLGDWILDGEAAELTDYNPAEDQLTLVWDMKSDPDPEIEVLADPLTPGLSHILVNGGELAHVYSSGAMSAGDIELVDYADMPDLTPT
ncbi:calcium-binding protein [Antarcticimicrobium sediminis]|uniref:Calcium-binding protein n=1 Tax=Antarcticimicrobium sediminis TaxID=2546227 RepID=A0A4R5ENI9_9RHOB|nr:calcium-binding protein [Antarcticimicrobium sediminis]TDE36020.1 calcium-binding protein [Antarcticimicrobium sediminis]